MFRNLLYIGIYCVCITACRTSTTTIPDDMIQTSATANMPYTILLSGQHSNMVAGDSRVLTSQEEFEEVLALMNSTRTPNIMSPEIDFSVNMLYLYASKELNAAYPPIKIVNIEKTSEAITVNAIQEMGGLNQPVLTVMTTPFIVLMMEKSNLPVTFQLKK